MHTMRSAFKRWLQLHGEDFRTHGYVRIPNWFRWYIRKNRPWTYSVTNNSTNHYCIGSPENENYKRKFKGQYQFSITDEELIDLQRAEWIKK